ncbi:MAG: hypothetical protein NZO58_06580, partial [Gemmataceae bacterium]|nr:hypothetical protein [Gemmataceae bacterium]
VPGHGTIKALRLEAPPPELVRKVVEARLRSVLPDREAGDIYPFTDEQVLRIAQTEPTLRDMLQQYRQLFDHLVYGEVQRTAYDADAALANAPAARISEAPFEGTPQVKSMVVVEVPPATALGGPPAAAPTVVTSSPTVARRPAMHGAPSASQTAQLTDVWDQQVQAARQQLEPDGALTGAARELQAALGTFLQICHEHGVKVGPWRLQHVVPEFVFSEHPTYGVISIAHWVCRDGQPWKVGIGAFMARGNGKSRDLETKLAAFDATPPVIDHLILLRPDDDLALSGKSKTLWQEAERRGRHARLEPVDLDGFALIYSIPRWLSAITESMPEGQAVPNLADLIQERCEKLLEQVCMPVP